MSGQKLQITRSNMLNVCTNFYRISTIIGMPKAVSIYVLMFVVMALVLLSSLHLIETLVENFSDPYAGADLSTLSDADRRTLTRASLTQQRATALNALSNVTTKVPPNCFDTTDAAYNTSACRMSRNARDAEVTKLVSQAYIDYCTANPDCKQAHYQKARRRSRRNQVAGPSGRS